MAEPWASYGRGADTVGEVGNPSPWLVAQLMEREADAQPRREQRRQQEEKASKAEGHETALMLDAMRWAQANGEPFDMLNPYKHIPPLETQIAIAENQEALQLRRKAMRALMDAGFSAEDARQMLSRSSLPEVRHDLPVLPQPSPEEVAEAEADLKLEAARHRTEIEGRRQRIRHFLKGTRA